MVEVVPVAVCTRSWGCNNDEGQYDLSTWASEFGVWLKPNLNPDASRCRREQAVEAVPDELILQTNFLGSVSEVTERVRAYRDAGISVLRVQPEGADTQERLDSLGGIVDIVRSLNNDGE